MIANIDGYSGKQHRTDANAGAACPDCGGPMKVADSARENGIRYTWYVCARPGCEGQWLQKEPTLRHVDKWRKYRAAAARRDGI